MNLLKLSITAALFLVSTSCASSKSSPPQTQAPLAESTPTPTPDSDSVEEVKVSEVVSVTWTLKSELPQIRITNLGWKESKGLHDVIYDYSRVEFKDRQMFYYRRFSTGDDGRFKMDLVEPSLDPRKWDEKIATARNVANWTNTIDLKEMLSEVRKHTKWRTRKCAGHAVSKFYADEAQADNSAIILVSSSELSYAERGIGLIITALEIDLNKGTIGELTTYDNDFFGMTYDGAKVDASPESQFFLISSGTSKFQPSAQLRFDIDDSYIFENACELAYDWAKTSYRRQPDRWEKEASRFVDRFWSETREVQTSPKYISIFPYFFPNQPN